MKPVILGLLALACIGACYFTAMVMQRSPFWFGFLLGVICTVIALGAAAVLLTPDWGWTKDE